MTIHLDRSCQTTLRNGPTLPTSAIELALDLEAKGWKFERDGMVLRLVRAGTSPGALTPAEATAVRQYKPHLLAIVDYCESGAATAPERTLDGTTAHVSEAGR